MKWNKASEKLPKKNGNYLAATRNGYMSILEYSTKYKLFNVWDGLTEKDARILSIDVDYWAKVPKPPKEG